MLQCLQTSSFPSSLPQAEHRYYRTVAAEAAYCGDACVFQGEWKIPGREDRNILEMFTHHHFFFFPCSIHRAGRPLRWEKEQDGRSACLPGRFQSQPATTSSPHAGLEASARRVLAFDQNCVKPETCREAGRLPGIG